MDGERLEGNAFGRIQCPNHIGHVKTLVYSVCIGMQLQTLNRGDMS